MTLSNISVALRLLDELVATEGRVFTSQEAVSAGSVIGVSPAHVYKVLTELTQHGLLDRPRGHLYVTQPPVGGANPVRPIAIGVRAVNPAAVSGETARVHWGLQDQAPLHEEIISTPARIQWTQGVRKDGSDRLWSVGGGTIRFHHVPPRAMIGVTMVRLDSDTVVPMFDRERAVLESLVDKTSAASGLAAELLEAHGDEIDFGRVYQYAEHLGAASVLAAHTTAAIHP